jgi:hypothetical protein
MSRFCALPSAVRARPRAWLGGLRRRDLRRRPGGGQQDKLRVVLKGRPRGRRGPPLPSVRGSQAARKRARSVDVIHIRRAYAGRAIGGMGARYARWPGDVVRQGGTAGGSSAGYKRPCRRPVPRGWRSAPDPRPAPAGGPSGCGNWSSHLPFVGLRRRASMIMFTCLPCPDRPVDLPLVMLPGLPEHGQQYDRPLSSTPVRETASSTPVRETASGHTSPADRLRGSRAARPLLATCTVLWRIRARFSGHDNRR